MPATGSAIATCGHTRVTLACRYQGWIKKYKKLNETVGPSKVRMLPLGVVAERSVHYFRDCFSFLSGS